MKATWSEQQLNTELIFCYLSHFTSHDFLSYIDGDRVSKLVGLPPIVVC